MMKTQGAIRLFSRTPLRVINEDLREIKQNAKESAVGHAVSSEMNPFNTLGALVKKRRDSWKKYDRHAAQVPLITYSHSWIDPIQEEKKLREH